MGIGKGGARFACFGERALAEPNIGSEIPTIQWHALADCSAPYSQVKVVHMCQTLSQLL